MKASRRDGNQTVNDADVATDDVDTLSGLLEAVVLLMMGIQTALEKVCLTCHSYQQKICKIVDGCSVSLLSIEIS